MNFCNGPCCQPEPICCHCGEILGSNFVQAQCGDLLHPRCREDMLHVDIVCHCGNELVSRCAFCNEVVIYSQSKCMHITCFACAERARPWSSPMSCNLVHYQPVPFIPNPPPPPPPSYPTTIQQPAEEQETFFPTWSPAPSPSHQSSDQEEEIEEEQDRSILSISSSSEADTDEDEDFEVIIISSDEED